MGFGCLLAAGGDLYDHVATSKCTKNSRVLIGIISVWIFLEILENFFTLMILEPVIMVEREAQEIGVITVDVDIK